MELIKNYLYIIKSEPTNFVFSWTENGPHCKYWEDKERHELNKNKIRETVNIYGEFSKEANEVRKLLIEEKIKNCDEYCPHTPMYKYGITNNIKQRLYYLEKEYNVKNIEIIYLKKYDDAKYFEDRIKYPMYMGTRDQWFLDNCKKEWFGEEESYIGGIRTLDHVLEIINEFNENFPQKIIRNSKCIVSEELKAKYKFL
jgi:hypothetical protein